MADLCVEMLRQLRILETESSIKCFYEMALKPTKVDVRIMSAAIETNVSRERDTASYFREDLFIVFRFPDPSVFQSDIIQLIF